MNDNASKQAGAQHDFNSIRYIDIPYCALCLAMLQPWSSSNVMTVPESDFALYRGKLSTSTATKLRSSSVRLGASKARPKGKHACMQQLKALIALSCQVADHRRILWY
jgi:hypothetical protein